MPNFLQKIRNAFKLKAQDDKPVMGVRQIPKEEVFSGVNTQLSPGQPLPASPLNPPSPITGRVPARAFEYRAGWNINTRPDQERQVSYQTLRWLANHHLVTRAAIDVRKKEIVGLKWDIGPADEDKPLSEAKRQELRKFWARPDGRQNFSQWLNEILEDMFVLDALCLEKRRKRNGNLLGLDVVDGATIKILIDATGRLPLPPAPAYQQVIYGAPRANFTVDELIYNPYNNQSNSPYGRSFIEAALLELNMSLKALTAMLNYFTTGSVAAGILNAPEGATPEQIAQLQQAWDLMMSGTETKDGQIFWVPANSQYQAFKDYDPAKWTELNDVLTRAILMAFEVQPQEVGLTFQVNKSSGDIQENITQRRAIRPLLGFLEDIFNDVMAFDLDIPDAVFYFDEFEPEDALTKAQEYQIYSGGKPIMTVNEIRQERGLEPIEGGDALDAPAPLPADGLFAYDWPEVEKELDKWERKELNDLRRPLTKRFEFYSDILPSPLMAEVEGALGYNEGQEVLTEEEIKAVFADVKKKYQTKNIGRRSTVLSKRTFGRSPRPSGNFTGNGGKAPLPRLACPRRY